MHATGSVALGEDDPLPVIPVPGQAGREKHLKCPGCNSSDCSVSVWKAAVSFTRAFRRTQRASLPTPFLRTLKDNSQPGPGRGGAVGGMGSPACGPELALGCKKLREWGLP